MYRFCRVYWSARFCLCEVLTHGNVNVYVCFANLAASPQPAAKVNNFCFTVDIDFLFISPQRTSAMLSISIRKTADAQYLSNPKNNTGKNGCQLAIEMGMNDGKKLKIIFILQNLNKAADIRTINYSIR